MDGCVAGRPAARAPRATGGAACCGAMALAITTLVSLSLHALPPLRAPPPTLLFPRADEGNPAPKTQGDRNVEMATLISFLADAQSDDEVQTLLDDATPMLLEPFRGFPEPGSIYEGLETTEAKADKYCTVIAERTKRARSTGNTAAATALERMGAHVLALLAAERGEGPYDPAAALKRLRGGGSKPKGAAIQSREWERQVDEALDKAESGIRKLRTELRGRSAVSSTVTAGDAAVAGFICGVACGTLLVGDPLLLGVGVGGTFAFAKSSPDKVYPVLAQVAWRGGSVVRRVRARL